MSLLGLRLQQASLSFIRCQATHRASEESLGELTTVGEVVCATEEDARLVDEWLALHGFERQARVATEKELADHTWMEENLF